MYYFSHAGDLPVWASGSVFHGGFLGVNLLAIGCGRGERRPLRYWIDGQPDFLRPPGPLAPGSHSLREGSVNFIQRAASRRVTRCALGIAVPRALGPAPRPPLSLYQFFAPRRCILYRDRDLFGDTAARGGGVGAFSSATGCSLHGIRDTFRRPV